MTDPRVPRETLRMSAYYYSFEPTGNPTIDRILSAVACAGKAFHHTESWSEETEPYLGCVGATPLDWIQNAANDAANELRAQLAQAEPVAWRYDVEPYSHHERASGVLLSKGLMSPAVPADKIAWTPLCAAPSCAEHDRLAQWISVSERLPEESRQLTRNAVLAYFNWGIRRDELPSVQLAEISCGHWRPISGNGDFDQYVTHWMPLPSAPESEERKP